MRVSSGSLQFTAASGGHTEERGGDSVHESHTTLAPTPARSSGGSSMGGGGGDLRVPKEIWSPAGGFFADPKKWRRNTLITVAGIASIAYLAFQQSIKMEERHARPHGPIISERWYSDKNFPPQ